MKFIFPGACLLMLVPLLFFAPLNSSAQTDADAIMIPKGYLCLGAMYSYSKWDHYWEGTFKRTNGNLGTVSTKGAVFMINYGITNRLNVMASIPYFQTHASAGQLAGQHGFQDLSAAVKWLALQVRGSSSALRLYTIGRVSLPLGNYEPDFLPMSIGLHSQTASLRGILDYQNHNLFISAGGAWVWRKNITLDRFAYYTDHQIYSNQVAMPNVAMFKASLGYRSHTLLAEAVIEQYNTLGGFDIRKNDMPFPSNRMIERSAGANFKYSFTYPQGLELTAGADYVLAGRNVGQSTYFHGGAFYLFKL